MSVFLKFYYDYFYEYFPYDSFILCEFNDGKINVAGFIYLRLGTRVLDAGRFAIFGSLNDDVNDY
jgi:hypothetical protein